MKVLLFGKCGQLGRRLTKELNTICEVVGYGRDDCDIVNRIQVKEVIKETRPNIIVNAAAFTQVDKAELNSELCWGVNVEGPMNIGQEAAKGKAILIHYSTDYVFDGSKTTPYDEDDSPNPINRYGESKLAGEVALEGLDLPYMVIRVGWLYSIDPSNFFSNLVAQFKEQKEVLVVTDQVGTPTSADYVAEMTKLLLLRARENTDSFFRIRRGLYHLGCNGIATRIEFATEILKAMRNKNIPVKTERIRPVLSHEYPSFVKRPAYSKLAIDKWGKMLEFKLVDWKEDLSRVVDQLN